MLVIESAREGGLTLQVDGRYLLSRYNPAKDAERMVPQDSGHSAFLLFSAGLGHFTTALSAAGIPRENIFIYEPQALQQEGWISSPMANLESWLEEMLLLRCQPRILSLPSFEKAFPQEFRELEQTFISALAHTLENIKVSSYFSRIWFINFWRNLWHRPGPAYFFQQNLPEDYPVVVTASGPSLAKSLPLLKKHRDKVCILSVLSSFNTLTESDICPDAVVLTDAGVGNILHGSQLPSKIPVFASVYASSALLSRLSNPVIFIDPQEISHPGWKVSQPSVSIDAGLLARKLSSGPLLFAGLDLGYSQSLSSHSNANAFQHRAVITSNRKKTVESGIMGWMRRSDLKQSVNGYVHGQFMQLSQLVSSLFPEAYYIPGVSVLEGLGQDTDWLDALPHREWKWQKHCSPLSSLNPMIEELWNTTFQLLLQQDRAIGRSVLTRHFLTGEDLSLSFINMTNKLNKLKNLSEF